MAFFEVEQLYACFQATVLAISVFVFFYFHFISSKCNIIIVSSLRGGLMYVNCTSQAHVERGQKNIPNTFKMQPVFFVLFSIDGAQSYADLLKKGQLKRTGHFMK